MVYQAACAVKRLVRSIFSLVSTEEWDAIYRRRMP